MTALRLNGIAKRFGNIDVLGDVSLDVGIGEFVALVGPSGCGKSTLLRIVAGIERPDSGTVRIGASDVTHRRPAQRDIAMVFQSYALYPHLTVAENIAVPLAMQRLNGWQRLPLIGGVLPGTRQIRAQTTRDVRLAADNLGLLGLLDRKPGQLSGGQRQRVALARAIVRHPSVFLMDEPLSNLDASLRVQARREIVGIHRRTGAATVYVTHDQSEALTMADRVAVMQSGKILQCASPEVIYNNPSDLRVATFIGSPRINTMPAEVDEQGRVRVSGLAVGLSGNDQGILTLAVRPEKLMLARRGLPAIVQDIEFLGDSLLLHARHVQNGLALVARITPEQRAALPADGRVHLDFRAADALLFDESGHRVKALAPLEALAFV